MCFCNIFLLVRIERRVVYWESRWLREWQLVRWNVGVPTYYPGSRGVLSRGSWDGYVEIGAMGVQSMAGRRAGSMRDCERESIVSLMYLTGSGLPHIPLVHSTTNKPTNHKAFSSSPSRVFGRRSYVLPLLPVFILRTNPTTFP